MDRLEKQVGGGGMEPVTEIQLRSVERSSDGVLRYTGSVSILGGGTYFDPVVAGQPINPKPDPSFIRSPVRPEDL